MSFKIDSVLGPMVGVVIHQDKTVEYSSHVRIVMQCPMDFEVYPFDTQECAFRASRYFMGKNGKDSRLEDT